MAGTKKHRLTAEDCVFALSHRDNNCNGIMTKTMEPTSYWKPESWSRYDCDGIGGGLGYDYGSGTGSGWGCFYADEYFKGEWWW